MSLDALKFGLIICSTAYGESVEAAFISPEFKYEHAEPGRYVIFTKFYGFTKKGAAAFIKKFEQR